MRRKTSIWSLSWSLSLAFVIGSAVSCSQNKPPSEANFAGSGHLAAAGHGDSSSGILPPKDARWTIYCQAIGGVDHVERANQAKAELLKRKDLKDWYVVHQETESVIYYGFYRSINDPKDPKETRRAQFDHQRLLAMTDNQGNRLLSQCLFVELSAPDPAAPPEWNLANATGYWSLQIGAFKDSPQRKQAAVEAVREARKAGIAAYYYHGDTTSSVCVGTWPEQAVKRQSESREYNDNPDRDLLVLPQPFQTTDRLDIRSKESGKRVQAVAPRLEAQDPSLIATMQQFPTHAVNGVVMTREVADPITGQQQEVPSPSFLVIIPHKTDSFLTNAASPAGAAQPPSQTATPALINPTGAAAAQNGGGKLRSIGE